jgi:hypothetical protein
MLAHSWITRPQTEDILITFFHRLKRAYKRIVCNCIAKEKKKTIPIEISSEKRRFSFRCRIFGKKGASTSHVVFHRVEERET